MTAELGLGLAALGRPAYITLGHGETFAGATDPDAVERRCHDVLDAARAGGVRYLDAARSYGRAEVFLGRWLRQRAVEPGELQVASKWGYRYVGGWAVDAEVHEEKEHSLQRLEQQWQKTREHLWEYLDVYQIHSATLETGVLEDAGVRAALGRLRDERGLAIGLSVTGPRQGEVVDRALAIEVEGRPLFTVVQATLNLLERSVEPALARASAAGRRVVIKEALANGRLAGAATGEARPGIGLADRLDEAARAAGLGLDAVALAAVRQRPFVDVVLSGASSVEQLRANLRATAVDSDLARALWDDTAPETAAAYWAYRASLPWT